MFVVNSTAFDSLSQALTTIAVLAMLAYLAPATLSLSSQWRRRCQVAAIVLIAVALLLAVADTIVWYWHPA